MTSVPRKLPRQLLLAAIPLLLLIYAGSVRHTAVSIAASRMVPSSPAASAAGVPGSATEHARHSAWHLVKPLFAAPAATGAHRCLATEHVCTVDAVTTMWARFKEAIGKRCVTVVWLPLRTVNALLVIALGAMNNEGPVRVTVTAGHISAMGPEALVQQVQQCITAATEPSILTQPPGKALVNEAQRDAGALPHATSTASGVLTCSCQLRLWLESIDRCQVS